MALLKWDFNKKEVFKMFLKRKTELQLLTCFEMFSKYKSNVFDNICQSLVFRER